MVDAIRTALTGERIGRRAVLRAGGAAAAAALAGCADSAVFSNPGDPPATASPDQPPRTTGRNDATTFRGFDVADEDFLPHVSAANSDATAAVSFTVEDADGVREIRLRLYHEPTDTTTRLPSRTPEGDTDEFQEQIPNRFWGPGNNVLGIEVVDAHGNTAATEWPVQLPSGGWTIDFKDAATGEDIGNYATDRPWDDFGFSHDRIWNQRMRWNQQEAYGSMIAQLNTSGPQETYNDVEVSAYYPDGFGEVWRKNRFQGLTSAEDVLRCASTATQIHQVAIKGIENRSRENDEFSTTVEGLVNTVHSTEQDYKRKITTTHVNQVGHGTSVAHVDTENTNLEADTNWWFLNTTDSDVRTLKDQQGIIANGYNPFVQGYTHGESDSGEITPETEKVIAAQALTDFVDRQNGQPNISGLNLTYSDEMLEMVYNEHILGQDGHVDPILDMVNQAGDYIKQHDEAHDQVTVIGDSWEEMEFGTGQELYEAAMDPDVKVTKDRAYELMDESAA